MLVALGCKPAEDPPAFENASAASVRVDFPPEHRADDQAVNDLVLETIQAATSGDYATFRLLWSAREEPITETEFRRAWQATRSVTIRALIKARFPDHPSVARMGYAAGETVYVAYAQVALDPDLMPTRTKRDMIIMVVREHDTWKLALPPDDVRENVKRLVMAAAEKGPLAGGTAPATLVGTNGAPGETDRLGDTSGEKETPPSP